MPSGRQAPWWSSSRARRGWARTPSSTPCGGCRPRRSPLRHHLHHPREALVRGGRCRLPLPDARGLPASCASEAGSWRRPRSTATGTARRATRSRRRSSAGKDAILKIDVTGARAVREAVPEALMVFVVPPSLDELRRRLVGRDTEPPEALGCAGRTRPRSCCARTSTTTWWSTTRARRTAARPRSRPSSRPSTPRTRTGDSGSSRSGDPMRDEPGRHPGPVRSHAGWSTSRSTCPGVPGRRALHLARAAGPRGPRGGRGGPRGVRPAPGGRRGPARPATRPRAPRRGRPSRCWPGSGPTDRC